MLCEAIIELHAGSGPMDVCLCVCCFRSLNHILTQNLLLLLCIIIHLIFKNLRINFLGFSPI